MSDVNMNLGNSSDAQNYYINDEGIPICKTCGHPLRIRQKLLGKEYLLPVMCECRRKQLEEDEKRRKEAEAREKIETLRRNSLMDEMFAESRFEKVVRTTYNVKALKIAHRYCENIDKMIETNQGMLFYGNVGTGKTLLAACIANELLDKGYKVIMTSIIKALDALGYGKDNDGYIQNINSADVLILDDFGAERKTDYAYEVVYNIIDSRYRAKKPLIITTNLPFSELTHRGDLKTDRIYDRVLDMCYPVEIPGISWRMMMAKERYEKSGKTILNGGD